MADGPLLKLREAPQRGILDFLAGLFGVETDVPLQTQSDLLTPGLLAMLIPRTVTTGAASSQAIARAKKLKESLDKKPTKTLDDLNAMASAIRRLQKSREQVIDPLVDIVGRIEEIGMQGGLAKAGGALQQAPQNFLRQVLGELIAASGKQSFKELQEKDLDPVTLLQILLDQNN